MVETPPTLPPPPPGAAPHPDPPPPVAGRPTGSGTDGRTPPPPPPEHAVRSDGPSRSVAATLVAAVGALLLLAAAGTFLAVTWDAVPIPARVALIGAATAAAIGGGAALRRRLPAVGAVVFHLGVLLVPVDVLGLCLQLGLDRATTWTAAGAATAGVLPWAGARGRAPVLGALGLVGVPVLATGVADLVAVPVGPALVAVAAAVVTATGWPGSTAVARRLGGPVLAVVAVVGPIVVAASLALVGAGGGRPSTVAASAGWDPTAWSTVAATGLLGTLTVAVAAWRQRSTRLAVGVAPLALLSVVGVALTGDAPRLALLLPGPLLFLAAGWVARLLADDELLAAPTRVAATTLELLAALTVPAALVLAVLGDVAVDLELATAAALTAGGWFQAGVRRRHDQVGRPVVVAAGIVTVAAAATLAGVAVGALVLLAGGVATLVWRADGPVGAAATASGVVLGVAAHAAVVTSVRALGLGPVEVLAVPLAATVVATLAAVVVVVRLAAHLDAGASPEVAATLLLPVHLVVVTGAASAVVEVAGEAPAAVLAVVLLLAGTWLLEGVRRSGVPADVLRALAAVVAVLVVVDPTGAGPLDDAAVAAPAAALVAVSLAADVLRTGRVGLAWLVGGATIRAVAGGAWALTGSRVTTGLVLLVVGLLAAAVASRREPLRLPAAATAALAASLGVALLAVSAHALAIALIGIGLAGVAAGLATRVPVVAHAGGLTAVTGTWWLTALQEVTALDVWAAPLALHLWLAALPARRDGRLSSWTADVPPLLLLVVPALLERVAGGGGWHAVVAGGAGIVAVVVGGAGRHGGPLVVGTLTVVAVVAIETLAVVAAVPTWGWLTVGGATLLGAAVVIERAGGSPVAEARRLREVLVERFD